MKPTLTVTNQPPRTIEVTSNSNAKARSKRDLDGVKVFVLGNAAVCCGSGPLTLIRGKTARMLFCVLGCSQGGPVLRDTIANLLWGPDCEKSAARLKLRQTLFRLKSQLANSEVQGVEGLIHANAEAIWLSESDVVVDYGEVQRLLSAGNESSIEKAMSLYGGDLFANETSKSTEFELWIGSRNSMLRQRLIEAGLSLAQSYRNEGMITPARNLLSRLAAISPASNEVNRELIALHMEEGRTDDAQQQYEVFANALKEEFEVDPGEDFVGGFDEANPFSVLPVAVPAPKLESYRPLRTDLPTSVCAPSPIAGSRMVSALSIALVDEDSNGACFDSFEGKSRWNKVENIIERAVVGLDGEVLLATPGRVEAVFVGTRGAETTPLRATYAAGRILSDLASYLDTNDRPPTQPLGITCGIVTRSNLGDASYRGMYSKTVLAALEEAGEICSLGWSGAIAVCGETYLNVNPVFICEKLAHDQDHKTQTYLLKNRRRTPRHFNIRVDKGLAPMIGREGELSFLREKWRQAVNGGIQLIVVRGELGIGRSRLVHEIELEVERAREFIIHLDCTYLHSSVPFYPIRNFLEAFFDIYASDKPSEKRRKIESTLVRYGQDYASYRPIIDNLIEGAFEDEPLARSGYMRDVVYPTLYKLLRFICGNRPVLLVVEDIDWIDPYTMDFLPYLHGITASLGHLMLATITPNSPTPQYLQHANAVLELGPLSSADCQSLIDSHDPENTIKPSVRAELVHASAAIPLYLEELVRSEVNSNERAIGAGSSKQVSVTSPRESLAAGDGLLRQFGLTAEGENTARVAAVVGRVFSVPLLRELVGGTREEFESHLTRLKDGRLIAPTESGDAKMMKFRHQIIRDSIYFSLPKKERLHLNRRVADIVSGPRASYFRSRPETIAQYYLEAEAPLEAVPHLIDAGVRAFDVESRMEALAYLETALEIVSRPNSAETAHDLVARTCLTLGAILVSTEGAGSESVEEIYRRARDAALATENLRQYFQATWGLWCSSMVRSNLKQASWLSQQLHREANRIGDSHLALEARHCLWTTCHLEGNQDDAWRHIDSGLTGYSKVEHRDLADSFGGHDPGVCCRTIGSIVAFLRGDAERSKELSLESVKLAMDLRHTGTLAQALWGAMDVAQFADDESALRQYRIRLLEVASAHRYVDYTAIAGIFGGWARVRYDGDPDGIRDLEEGLAIKSELEGLGLPFQIWLLADAQYRLGRLDEAMRQNELAQGIAERSGEAWWLPELYRTELHLRLRVDPVVDDEHRRLLSKGIELAQSQGAVFLLRRLHSIVDEFPDLNDGHLVEIPGIARLAASR